MSAETSAFGRDQFSVEKVYNVNTSTPISPQIRVIFLTELMPSLCPANRGNLLLLAHRPLPSIIMAICLGICPRDKRFFISLSIIDTRKMRAKLLHPLSLSKVHDLIIFSSNFHSKT
jgi:hypothetical protein